MFAKRFRNQKRLFIKLRSKILYDNNTYFGSNSDCYIAKAIKEQFPDVEVEVFVVDCKINGTKYRILGNIGDCSFLEVWKSSGVRYVDKHIYPPDSNVCCFYDKGGFVVVPLERVD